MKSLIFLSVVCLLASCAIHDGMLSSPTSLANPSCERIGTAYGSSKTWQLFGIGGTQRDALVLDAKEEMYRNFSLVPGQHYDFVTVDFKRSFFPFFSSTQVVVSADILDCNSGEQTNEGFSSVFKPKAYPGSQLEPGKIVATSTERYKIVSLNMNGFKAQKINQPYFRTKALKYDEILGNLTPRPVRLQGSYYILAPGDTITFRQEQKNAKAILINPSNLQVAPLEEKEGEKFILKPDDVIVPKQ